MEYLLLIYGNEADVAKMTEAQHGAMYQEFGRFNQSIQQSGTFARATGCSLWQPPLRCARAMVSGW